MRQVGAARIVASLFLATISLVWLSTCHAAMPLLAGPALARQLQQRVTLAWDDQEVAAALERLADVQQMPLWIDRRIDPHARVSLAGANLTLAELMDRLAATQGLDWGWSSLRSVVYFGPRETARDLATLSELARAAIAKAPTGMRRAWITPGPWEFPRLSEPKTLFEMVASDAGTQVREGTSIPHDVWPACSLPGVSPIDRAVLILAGFDLQLAASPDGRQAGAVKLESPVQLTATYPTSERLQAVVDALSATDPTLRTRRQGRRTSISGRWEDHEQVRRALNPRAIPDGGTDEGAPPQAGEQRFTLRIANKPVGAVLDQLSAQLQLEVSWDPVLANVAPPVRETLISCEVREVDLDGLLSAVLTPASLTFARDGATVTIRASHSNSVPGSAGR
jgi:hypothetical protein